MSKRLTAGEACTRIVTVAFRGMRLAEAAQLMREDHVGCLVVVEEADPGRVVIGVLTDRDIVVSVLANDRDARYISVGEAMTTEVVTAREDDSVLDLLEVMRRKGIRRIPITGPQNVLVGVATLDDLLEVVAEEMQALAGAISRGR
ncbi:MAG TPA: CBS domain-containing protein [Albitalea sp.]